MSASLCALRKCFLELLPPAHNRPPRLQWYPSYLLGIPEGIPLAYRFRIPFCRFPRGSNTSSLSFEECLVLAHARMA